ncbi:SDR family NAD(P)-dependent oxidoreductase [Kytococcus sp. Marseille-QA3725]
MIDFTDKVALVTGASSGIGRAIALTLAKGGATVVNADLTEQPREGGNTTVEQITSEGGAASYVELDVTDPTAVEAAVQETVTRHGSLDILVNNAGVLTSGSILDTDDDTWRKQFAVNVDGTFFCTRAAIKQMLAQGRGGKVVNISSISGFRGNPEFAAYCASKGAILNLTRQVAIDYAPHGINVNSVAPGFVTTEMTALYDQPTKDALTGQTPRDTWATPQNIADAVAFLASSMADHVVGENLLVDGGWTVGTPVRA